MKFLVDMSLRSSLDTLTPAEGVRFIDTVIFPTLERCLSLESEGTITAGGPAVGAIRLVFVAEAQSADTLEEELMRLAIWPMTKTAVLPLTTFQDRRKVVSGLHATLKNRIPHPGSVEAHGEGLP